MVGWVCMCGGGWRGGGEQTTRRQARASRTEAKKKRAKEGARHQVLISNRLLVMRSLFHCSQIDFM